VQETLVAGAKRWTAQHQEANESALQAQVAALHADLRALHGAILKGPLANSSSSTASVMEVLQDLEAQLHVCGALKCFTQFINAFLTSAACTCTHTPFVFSAFNVPKSCMHCNGTVSLPCHRIAFVRLGLHMHSTCKHHALGEVLF
jgi:hypothetical protein